MTASPIAYEVPGRHAWARSKRRRHRRHAMAALREMRGGPGPGPFGGGPHAGPHGPFGGFGPGPRGRRRGRARRGDVRLALLRLLAEEPRNGYQLMQAIEERSGGDWRPSPGSVYPTLSQLEDEGLVRSTEADGARHFEITDQGRSHLEERTAEPDPWQMPEGGHSAGETRQLIGAVAAAAMQVAQMGDEQQRAKVAELLKETRRALYRILAEDPEE
ncbi:MAG: PadR family transcriptional regulator [Actinomycetota bacterium]|nr:PadR family transcriptional regulator [Actinomycetota bacterium]